MLGSYRNQDHISIFILYWKKIVRPKRTSLRPLFPLKLHAWQALPAASASQLSGSPATIVLPSCCKSTACLPRQRCARRCRWWRSSWWTFLSCWSLCLGGPASGPCRCTKSMTRCASFFSFHRPSWVPWRHSWTGSLPSWRFRWVGIIQARRAFFNMWPFVSQGVRAGLAGAQTART